MMIGCLQGFNQAAFLATEINTTTGEKYVFGICKVLLCAQSRHTRKIT